MTCKHCTEFFKRYRCARDTIGECDCPKCQGYCECELLVDPDGPLGKALLKAHPMGHYYGKVKFTR